MNQANKRKTTGRSAFDSMHVKSVVAWGLMHPDRPSDIAGRVVAAWGGGGGCTCTVSVWAGPLYQAGRNSSATGRASGYGYCKFSAAAAEALGKLTGEHVGDMAGAGPSEVRKYLESLGYTVIEVISAG